MKHLSIKVFGKETFEYNTRTSDVVDITDKAMEERIERLSKRIGAFEHGMEKMLSMLQDYEGNLRLLTEKENEGTRLQDVPAPAPGKHEMDWSLLSISEARNYMGAIYNDVAAQFKEGSKDAVLAAGIDYDQSKPVSKVIDAIKAGMDKRGYRVRIDTNGVDELVVVKL